MRRYLITAVLTILCLAAHSASAVEPIRFGSGYPQTSQTAGHPVLGSSYRTNAFSWGATGLYVSIVGEPMIITRIAGIGQGPGDAPATAAELGVFNTAQEFADDARNGTVHAQFINSTTEAVPLGTVTWWNQPLWYQSFEPVPFRLEPGNYIFTVVVPVGSGTFQWAESSINLGSDILTADSTIGEFYLWSESGVKGMTTGTAAVDVYGVNVPSPRIVFRKSDSDEGSFWGEHRTQAPGWDHVGLQAGTNVIEAHKSTEGDFWDPNAERTIRIEAKTGVQAQHLLGSFKHFSESESETDAASTAVEIPEALALSMKSRIETRMDAGYRQVESMGSYLTDMLPDRQKGLTDNTFSNVGLLEWAAEESGWKNGQGFVPDGMELLSLPGGTEIPMLTPDLLAFNLEAENELGPLTDWLTGFFDPVDFMLTDPLGRRLGYTEDLGLLNEIPGAYYTGDGSIEQFLIANPLAGQYDLQLLGLDEETLAGWGTATFESGFEGYLEGGETRSFTFDVNPVPEPSTFCMLLSLGLTAAAGHFVRRRRGNKGSR